MHLLGWLNLGDNIDGYTDDVNVSWILDEQDSDPAGSMQPKFNRLWSTKWNLNAWLNYKFGTYSL